MIIGFIILLFHGAGIVSAQNYEFKKGENIPRGQVFKVPSGIFIFQLDGNAVIYENNTVAIWHTNTANNGYKLVFERNGNLILYHRNGLPLWDTGSNRRGERLVFQSDRNLVIYNRKNFTVWHSGTTVE